MSLTYNSDNMQVHNDHSLPSDVSELMHQMSVMELIPDESHSDEIDEYMEVVPDNSESSSELSVDEKIELIKEMGHFSDQLVYDIQHDKDWHEINSIFAEQVGYIGEHRLYDVIMDEYIRTNNMHLLECMYVGASKAGDNNFHICQKVVEDGLDINRPDVIFNLFESNIPRAITNLFKLGVSNENAIFFAAGATGNIKLIDEHIYKSNVDIMIPLYAACECADRVTIDYYFSKMDIFNCVDPYKLLSIALEYKQFSVVDCLIEYGIDLIPLMKDDIPDHRFNHAKYWKLLREYLYTCDNFSTYESYDADIDEVQ